MLKEDFEAYLAQQISNNYVVDQAMNYSLLAKGKRFRPLLLLNLLLDLDVEPKEGYAMASAIEMVHTYSLIHDDLPAFDNDDYRRGQLTCHKMFNEETAILAGDSLLTLAFEMIVKSNYEDNGKAKLVYLLAKAAGHEGMIKGQQFDKQYEKEKATLEQLLSMYRNKTGCLIALPLLSALVIAKIENNDLENKFQQIGYDLGIAFQIQDDLLEVTSNSTAIGKSTSDIDNNKQTYYSLSSIKQAQDKVDELFNNISTNLEGKYSHLEEYINSFKNRNW